MDAAQIHEMAQRLREVDGDRAIAEAAQKAQTFEKAGDQEQAQLWRKIEKALIEMRGPHES